MFIFKVYTHAKKPVTFELPFDKRRMKHIVGDIVKVVIFAVPPLPGPSGERIWVKILKEIDEFGYYKASWANVPIIEEAIELEEFPVHYTNIIDYWGKHKETEKPRLKGIKGGKP